MTTKRVLCLPVMKCGVHLSTLAIDLQTILIDVDDELREEGLQQRAADFLRDAGIELARLFEEVDESEDNACTVLQPLFGLCQSLLNGTLLQGDLVQPFGELVACHLAVCCKIDEPFLLGLELGELAAEGSLGLALRGLELHKRLFNLEANRFDAASHKLLARHGSIDSCFDVIHA